MEKISQLDDPLIFVHHLLLHEIAHIKRREIHASMIDGDIERDCDEWAFLNLEEENQSQQPTSGQLPTASRAKNPIFHP